MYYTYVYLDPRVNGNFIYENLKFDYVPIYVGKGKNTRDVSHLKKCLVANPGTHPFYDKLRKIISDGYQPIIVKIKEFNEENDSLKHEKYLISLIKRIIDNGTLLNLTEGGIGGDTFSGQTDKRKLEIRDKISISNKGKNKGKKCSDKQKEQLRIVNIGKKASIETRKKMSNTRLGKPIKVNMSEQAFINRSNSHKNVVFSEESRKKMSDAKKGKAMQEHTCPYCNKIGKSNAMKRWHFENCKEK